MEDPDYQERYSYTFDASTNNMRMYVKADVSAIGIDASNKVNSYTISELDATTSGKWHYIEKSEYPWNAPIDNDTSNPYIPTQIPTGLYPYVAYNGTIKSI